MRQVTRKGLMTVAAATGVIAAAGGYAHADSGASGSATNSPGVGSGNTVQAPVHVPVNVCGNTVDVIGLLNPAVGNKCANTGGGGGASSGYGDSGGHEGSGGSYAGGHATGSPGVASGNTVQAPVHVPVNACGNSVNVVGIGNPAAGNECANTGGGGGGYGGSGSEGGHGHDGGSGGAHAGGQATGSPGVGSGNHVEAPVDVPVNVCGNSVNVIGIGNTAVGDDCANGGGPGGGHETTPPGKPGSPEQPGNPGEPGTPPAAGGEGPGGSSHANQPGAQSVDRVAGAAQLAATGSELPLGLAVPVGAGALLAGAVLYRKARASA